MKKVIAGLLTVLVLGILLAGCGNDSDQSSGDAATDQVTISLAWWGIFHLFINTIYSRYSKGTRRSGDC